MTMACADPAGSVARCNGDPDCLQTERLIPHFVKENNIPEADVREALNNCDLDRNIRFCQWFYRFGAEIKVKEQMARLVSTTTKTCASRVLARQRQWERIERKRCEDEATEDTGYWGRRQHELLEICLRTANDQRGKRLNSIAKCSPCSLCE